MKFTEKLDYLMSVKGITRGELAKLSDVPYTTIVGFYEKGYDNVKLSTLRKLVSYFGCTLDYLADDETKKTGIIIDDAGLDDMDKELVRTLRSLSEEEANQVRAFVQGLKACRKD